MTISGDRLSRLPDPVLWQILSHTPAKEAVCTGALSRPWRSHWLSSGVLNLDSRSYGAGQMPYSRSLIFIRDANAALRALAAANAVGEGSSLRKLTFTFIRDDGRCDENLYCSQRNIDQGLSALLSGTPAVRVLEELHVHVWSRDCFYTLGIDALPSDALRALHLDGLYLWRSERYSPAPFALLDTLRLRMCYMPLKDLQVIVDSAPLLTALELDRVYLQLASSSCQQRLRCPRVTAISLADSRGMSCGRDGIVELDAPLLRRFTYKGFIRPFKLVLPSPASMAQADLHFYLDFFHDNHRRKDDACRLFWHFVGNFGGTEVLNVSFEQPGAQRRARQFKKLDLRGYLSYDSD